VPHAIDGIRTCRPARRAEPRRSSCAERFPGAQTVREARRPCSLCGVEASLATRIAREVYRRELIPERVLWWLAAEGMRDWFRVLGKRLEPHLPETRSVLAALAARMFERRREALVPSLRSRLARPRDLALLVVALYRLDRAPKAAWILDGLGGAPRSIGERARARWLLVGSSAFEPRTWASCWWS
jgi:hypothetical protein